MSNEHTPILCCKCGKKLGEVGDGYMYIRHKGRSIKISPEKGAKCSICVTCDGKLCNAKTICTIWGLDKPE